HAAHGRTREHRGVLGVDVGDVPAEPFDAVDRLHLLPEQVGGVEVHPDVRRLDLLQELLEGGRGGDQVAWMHLAGDLHVVLPVQGLAIHAGYRAPSCVPGVPDMATTSGTPGVPASSMVRRRSWAWGMPSVGSGDSGLPETVSPVSWIPLSWKIRR